MGFDQIFGATATLGGALVLLYINGVLPRREGDPEAWARWRKDFGFFKFLGPFLIVYGVIRFLGYL